jgi:hypothetical protein
VKMTRASRLAKNILKKLRMKAYFLADYPGT